MSNEETETNTEEGLSDSNALVMSDEPVKMFGHLDNTCEVSGTALFEWGLKDFGFGQLYFYVGEDGKTHCHNECMSNESVKKILNTLVDTCVMDNS